MRNILVTSLAAAIVGLFFAPQSSFAQSATAIPPHVPLQKTIGQAKAQVVPSLIVLNSRSASLQGNKLVLTGVATNAIVFADRPVRAAGHDTTAHVVEDWDKGSDNFAKDPPNATVSGFTKEGTGVKDAVVVLSPESSRATSSLSTSKCSRATQRGRMAPPQYSLILIGQAV